MKSHIISLALASALLVSCYPTRIVTWSPSVYGTQSQYSTVVTVPRTHTTTTTTQVYAASDDISLQLDLQAVAAAFAQSGSVKEFESLLNSSSYMISNLDLNGDGYVDYLRVLETIDGNAHLFLIQAVLAQDVYQDVATLVVESPYVSSCYLEVIGAPYIYGPDYVVRPSLISRPPLFAAMIKPGYEPWHSPWHWNSFPTYYKHPKPLYLNHYQAYVKTYMASNMYCRDVYYPEKPHYSGYNKATQKLQRADYAQKHPEHSFTTRNANTPKSSATAGNRALNARDIYNNHESTKSTSTTVLNNSRTSSSVTRSAGSTTSTKSSASGTSTTSNRSVPSSSSSATRSASSTSPARTAGSSSSSSSRSSSSASQTTRSAGSTSSSSTTVRSRVSSSGSSSTSISTKSSSGSSTTVRRSSGSSSSSSSSARSSSSSSTSRSSSSSSRSTGSSSSSSSSSTSRGTRR